MWKNVLCGGMRQGPVLYGKSSDVHLIPVASFEAKRKIL